MPERLFRHGITRYSGRVAAVTLAELPPKQGTQWASDAAESIVGSVVPVSVVGIRLQMLVTHARLEDGRLVLWLEEQS